LKKLLILIFLFAVLSLPCFADTFIYNKIKLEPYYIDSMKKNVGYNFTLTVKAPDNIAYIVSSIINFYVFTSGVSTNYTLYVNNSFCGYLYVSTSYANSGQNKISFDCTKNIKQSGTYKITLVSSADSGSVYGDVEITYSNRPPGDIKIHGTEYVTDEKGTVFLQLVDSQGNPVNNGNCLLSIYKPVSVNSTHDLLLKDAPMMYSGNDDGIYYYDLNIPNITGVYMLSVFCSYEFGGGFVYSLSGEETNYPERTVLAGTYTGSPIFLNNYVDWEYTRCDSGAGKICDAYYDFNATIHYPLSELQNITSMSLYYMGEASRAATVRFYYWNWTNSSWVLLPNNLTFIASGSSTPVGIGDFVGNKLPNEALNNNTGIIRIRTYSTVGGKEGYYQFDNWLNIQLLTSRGTVQDVKGSSELHVSELYGRLNNSFNEIPFNVWNYSNRTLTDYNQTGIFDRFDALDNNLSSNFTMLNNSINYWGSMISSMITSVNDTLYSLINSVASSVWNYEVRNLTYYPSLSASDIWEYENRTLTDYNQTEINNKLLEIKSNLTDMLSYLYEINQTTHNITVSTTILEEMINDLDSAMGSNFTLISSLVLSSNSTIMSKLYLMQDELSSVNNTVKDINSSLSMQITDVYNSIGEVLSQLIEVKSDIYSVNSTMTYLFGNLSTTLDYISSLISSVNTTISEMISNIAGNVWNYETRNLTYYPEANYTAISENIWNYENRTLTWYNNSDIISILENINDTLSEKFEEISNDIININASISSQIESHNNTLVEVNNSLSNMIEDVSKLAVNISDILLQTNNSIISKLYSIQGELESVNNTVKDVNSSLSIQITDVYNRIEDAINYMYSVNSTLSSLVLEVNSSLVSKLETVESLIIDINNSMNNMNSTLSYKLSQIYSHIDDVLDDLYNHNATLVSVNSTIMGKLYLIQDEIRSINVTDLVSEVGSNLTVVNESISLLISNLPLISAQDVWTYGNRTLTDYNQTWINTMLNSINNSVSYLGGFIDNWFNILEYKLDYLNNTLYNITIGNVTVNATVDLNAIAMETLRKFCYYGAIDLYDPGICQGPVYRGGKT